MARKHKHAELIIAYANDIDTKFECRAPGNGVWRTVNNPSFHESLDWRMKPQPKRYRMYKNSHYNTVMTASSADVEKNNSFAGWVGDWVEVPE